MPSRTRLKTTHADYEAAVSQIEQRRRKHDSPRVYERFSDDALDAIGHVLKYQRVPPEVLAEDIQDALTLLEYARTHVPALPAVLERIEHQLLTSGAGTGLSYGQMGTRLGITKQGVQHRILRYESHLRGLPRNERRERQARRADQAERRWLSRNASAFVTLVEFLPGYRPDLEVVGELVELHGTGDDLDDLCEYAQQMRDEDFPEAGMRALRAEVSLLMSGVSVRTGADANLVRDVTRLRSMTQSYGEALEA